MSWLTDLADLSLQVVAGILALLAVHLSSPSDLPSVVCAGTICILPSQDTMGQAVALEPARVGNVQRPGGLGAVSCRVAWRMRSHGPRARTT